MLTMGATFVFTITQICGRLEEKQIAFQFQNFILTLYLKMHNLNLRVFLVSTTEQFKKNQFNVLIPILFILNIYLDEIKLPVGIIEVEMLF